MINLSQDTKQTKKREYEQKGLLRETTRLWVARVARDELKFPSRDLFKECRLFSALLPGCSKTTVLSKRTAQGSAQKEQMRQARTNDQCAHFCMG